MNKLLLTLSFLTSLIGLTSQSLALPPCPTSGYKYNCYGSFTWESGSTYIGEFQNNKRHGKGIYTWINPFEQYVGEYKNGKIHGQGTYTYADGENYSGEYKNGNHHGQGTYTYANGSTYIGEWKNDKRNGQGTFTWKKSGNKYVGEFKNDNINGQGAKTYTNGTIEEGIWENGKFMYAKKPTSNSNPKIEGYKTFCSEIGFTPGTEKYGECVVEAMKKG